MSDLTRDEWEMVLARDLEYMCDQLKFQIESYRKLIADRRDERTMYVFLFLSRHSDHLVFYNAIQI